MPSDLVQIAQPKASRASLPPWLRKTLSNSSSVVKVQRDLRSLGLHTVCESARCPNIHECFHRGTATFLILGGYCTRRCRFCAVPKVAPEERPADVDPNEPRRVAEMAARLGLRYVVITSVTRDDLPDGGSAHWANVVREVRNVMPKARVEILTPDFGGDPDNLVRVLDSAPDVFNHNVETVRRLYADVRPQADYDRSLEVLRFARRHRPNILVKSGLMVGLGETPEEVESLLRDLHEAGVDIVTIGQYLQPTRLSLPVAEYVKPAQFDAWRDFGLALGFRAVASGPFVRSSYNAEAIGGKAGEQPC
ncbi:MAG: lipoyl synthase [Bryobacteraceae bacterium]